MAVDKDVLESLNINDWKDISDGFEKADLILGNGFSLRFSHLFEYASLFEEFLHQCSSEDRKLFEGFGTTDFEAIQEQLLNAKKVNKLLDLPTAPIDPAIEKLRQGLITSVESNHPRARDIDVHELQAASESLDQFEDVYTFNYDLLLYRMIMLSKARSGIHGTRRHNDYFWQDYNDEFLEFVGFDDLPNKHVYFLHGALFLFPGSRFEYYNDLKIK